MSKIYRTAEVRRNSSPTPILELNPTCEYCSRHRSHGSHAARSKKRQAKYQTGRQS
jgi:hypothetical protein